MREEEEEEEEEEGGGAHLADGVPWNPSSSFVSS